MIWQGQQAAANRHARPDVDAGGALFGAVDLGTHHCRLLIAGADGQRGLRVVDALSRAARLGEGLVGSGRLSEAAMDRAIAALAQCERRMRRRGVARARAVATEACRRAGNCAEFLARVHRETGLELQPISPEEESGLTLAGCRPLLDPARRHALLFDIGGGSTEVIWVEQTTHDDAPRIRDLLSLPVGVLTLNESLAGETDAAVRRGRIEAVLDAALAAFDHRNGIARAIRDGGVQVIGTSGTVTTLAAVLLGLRRYRRSQVDGVAVDFGRIAGLCRTLADSDVPARAALPCVGPERADLLGVGCAIVGTLYRRWPAHRLTVADRGIREGILLRMLAEECGAAVAAVAAVSP